MATLTITITLPDFVSAEDVLDFCSDELIPTITKQDNIQSLLVANNQCDLIEDNIKIGELKLTFNS